MRILGPVLGGQEPPKWRDAFLTIGRLHEYTVRLQFEELSLHGYDPNGWVRCSLDIAQDAEWALVRRHADSQCEFIRGGGGYTRTYTSDLEYSSPAELEAVLAEIAGALATWTPAPDSHEEDEE
jgi:hypothetical protein